MNYVLRTCEHSGGVSLELLGVEVISMDTVEQGLGLGFLMENSATGGSPW